MSETLTRTYPEPFLKELRSQAVTSTRLASMLGAFAFFTFAFVDPWIVDTSLAPLIATRAVSVTLLLAIFASTFSRGFGERNATLLVGTAYMVIVTTVIILTWLTGGAPSRYLQALHITMFGFAILPLPCQPRDAIGVAGLTVVGFNVMLAVSDTFGPTEIWVTSNAMLVLSTLVSVILFLVSMRGRFNEFTARNDLASANRRLQDLDRAKNRFFANLSHELRTPLTLTLAPVESLLDDERVRLSPGQREKLTLVKRNALRLLRLVDDLLALSKAEAARLRLRLETVNLKTMVGALLDEARELTARKQITLTYASDTEVPTIEADPALVERVLLNLVGNAAKFTSEHGEISVRLTGAADRVQVAVRDTGTGIPADALPKIFDRFYQVDDASTRAVGGTGIGLALAREIVELHGGKISAESVEGEGSTLMFWLPLEPPKSAAVERRRARVGGGGRERRAAQENGLPEWHEALKSERSYRMLPIDDATERRVAPRSRSQGRAPMVLVVEDNRDMIQFLVTLLAPAYNTMTALDGVQGLRLAAAKQPDVIVSDVMMPEMDGFEMLRQLRHDPKTRNIPVILLTAKGEAEDRIEGRTGGADAYLHKPFRADELLAAVAALATRQESVLESARRDRDEALVFLAGGVTDVLTTAATQFSEAFAALNTMSMADGPQAQALIGARTGLTELMALTHELRHFSLAGVGDEAVEVSVNEAVSRAVAIAQDAAAGREITATLEARRSVSFPLGQLDRVVLHLLLNAIDATVAPGTIHVHTEDGLAGEVIIRVQDNGPGVPAQYAEHVFFPYYSTDPEAKPGMGLAVSRRIVELHGGKLQVEREEAIGSAFVVRLPSISPRRFPAKRLG